MRRTSETFEEYNQFEKYAELRTGRPVRILRTDRSAEYVSKAFHNSLLDRGIQQQLSTGEIPQQNGVYERLNWTLMDLIRSMLLTKHLPKQFWAESLATAVYARNRVTSRALPKNTTSHHIWHGKEPNLEHVGVLGCQCRYKIPCRKLEKLDIWATETIMIGCAERSKAY